MYYEIVKKDIINKKKNVMVKPISLYVNIKILKFKIQFTNKDISLYVNQKNY